MMPAFQHLSQQDKDAIASFVLNLQNEQSKKYTPQLSALDSFRMLPYEISGYNKFITKSGLPARLFEKGLPLIFPSRPFQSGFFVPLTFLLRRTPGCQRWGGP